MNKRKFFYLMTLVAFLFAATSCSQEDDPTVGKVKVTFLAHLPETIDSRAIGDGSMANELFFWVFDEDDNEVQGLRQHNIAFDQTGTARVTAYLTPGHTFSFAFWAQHRDITCYNPYVSSLVQMDYEDVFCNDETRDGFWNWIPNLAVTEAGEVSQEIRLVRRLSQVNVGITTDGYELAKAAGIDLLDYDSELIIENDDVLAYSAFNVREGAPFKTDPNYWWNELDFLPAPMPDEPLNIRPNRYVYLALSYFQTDVDQYVLGDVTLVLHHKTIPGKTLEYKFPNARFKGNYRTNLLIRDLTSKVNFDVIIDENFDNLDYNYDVNGNPITGGGDNGGNNGNG